MNDDLTFFSWYVLVNLQRITIQEIKNHPWFLKNLPVELMEGGSWQSNDVNNPSQNVEEVLSIIQEARKALEVPKVGGYLFGGSMDLDDLDADADLEDIETSGDFVCPL
jgi:serine/threonine-protein kinase SRK2